MPGKQGTLPQRFWAKVKKAGPDECWLWTGGIQKRSGYGKIQVGGRGTPVIYVQRLAVILDGRSIPAGHEAHHTCHVRLCCNPRHLSVLTTLENAREANQYARYMAGMLGGPAVELTPAVVQGCAT
jgi:hypothetical protein